MRPPLGAEIAYQLPERRPTGDGCPLFSDADVGSSAPTRTTMNTRPPSPRILGVLFVTTGGTALLIEQIFEKLLATVVGASAPAATLVLAVYFLGLTLGAAGYAALGRGRRRPLRIYAAAEGWIGAWALGLALARGPLLEFSAAVVHLGGDSLLRVQLLRLVVAGVWILPPTIAMGASFPAVVGALEQLRVPDLRRATARFYSWNLLGAFAGTLIGPYAAFPALGLTGTLIAILVLQAFVVAAAFRMSARLPDRPVIPQPGRGDERPDRVLGTPDRFALLRAPGAPVLILLAFASGFLFFGLEVMWAHLVGAVIGTSVYAFANMLAAVLLGLFVGGLAASFLFGDRTAPPAALPLLVGVSALVLAISMGFWDRVGELFVVAGRHIDSFAEGEALRLLVAAALIGVPSAVLGLIYPTLFRDARFPAQGADGLAGGLAGANALGSISGALLTGLVLLPALGSESLYRLFVLALALLAIILALGILRAGGGRGSVATTVALAAVSSLAVGPATAWHPLALTSGANVYFLPAFVQSESRLLFWHEHLFGGFTTVVENRDGDISSRTLLSNGKFQGNDGGEMVAQIGFALVPLIHQPRRGRGLVIGLGTGHTASVVAAAGYPALEIAENAPGVVAAARDLFAHVNDDLLEKPGVALHLEDGRNVLLRSDRRYDLIVMELNSIWFAGASNLYSLEFYELARDRLTDGAVFQQWIQLHHIAPDEVASAISTLRSVFPYVEVWEFGGQGILLASDRPLEIDPSHLETLGAESSLAPHLRILQAFGGPSLPRMVDHRILDEAATTRLQEWSREHGIPLHTDGNRFLEYATPRHNLERRDHRGEVRRFLDGFAGGAPETVATSRPAP